MDKMLTKNRGPPSEIGRIIISALRTFYICSQNWREKNKYIQVLRAVVSLGMTKSLSLSESILELKEASDSDPDDHGLRFLPPFLPFLAGDLALGFAFGLKLSFDCFFGLAAARKKDSDKENVLTMSTEVIFRKISTYHIYSLTSTPWTGLEKNSLQAVQNFPPAG